MFSSEKNGMCGSCSVTLIDFHLFLEKNTYLQLWNRQKNIEKIVTMTSILPPSAKKKYFAVFVSVLLLFGNEIKQNPHIVFFLFLSSLEVSTILKLLIILPTQFHYLTK